MHRRNFLKTSGIAALPSLGAALPFTGLAAQSGQAAQPDPVYFFFDGPFYNPKEFIARLQQVNQAAPIEADFYGGGGVVEALEKKFMAITGKGAAIFMPTGTMANQLAIAVLSGDNTKVFVQDTSHIFRDEADAAQSIHNKRLIPLAPNEAAFTLAHLQASIKSLDEGEVFKSGIGAIAIENPVRRCDGRTVDIEEIKKIAAWCREKGYKLHLDGARIHLASAFTGIPVTEYARHFDTVYISLYKYLGAPGGAMLCGDKAVIDKMRHLIKVHGGTMYQFWINAAMALYHLEGLEERLKAVVKRSAELFTQLNKLPGLQINTLKSGTNIFELQVTKEIDLAKLRDALRKEYNIYVGNRQGNDPVKITVNETLLSRDTQLMVEAFKASLAKARA
ncbi:aminotransferase class I/II-fold pyridoxal phosphate-dependent enzyme [Paraflavitalea soli]|uniref:Aminotransferase class I/II-fold pyridoxal phosphate-dependent enzyme n=1 Tax=Paraflavitalea soli TaxID=2315862 RepID=A0A3B7MF29_9BACT|nr:aminotransferase class I/II-fold pyridoxal phosphate-dependent enzyme [Paraflavitalea soli]AXY72948.1 aminotransferase class I/II-fold pyridoxal phosphate-dependent enzyme [Paraflavitalea soli]